MNAEATTKGAERAQTQRERILNAAQTCFVKYGFHAAGMAAIAEAAEMSPGLIYRYFENKSAIILAIIERQSEENCAQVCHLQSAAEFTDGVIALFDSWKNADPQVISAALFLEMTAEASRDPIIAQPVRAFDMTLRSRLCEWMSRDIAAGGMGLPPEVAAQRTFSLQCFVEGLAIRTIREPDLSAPMVKSAIEQFLVSLSMP